jgi:hypothetical protein
MNQPMPPVTIGIEVRRHDGGEADWARVGLEHRTSPAR